MLDNNYDNKYKSYLKILGEDLKIYLESVIKELMEFNKNHTDATFVIGKLYGYMEIISMIQQQSVADGLTLKDVGLDNFNPEKYINQRIDEIKGRKQISH